MQGPEDRNAEIAGLTDGAGADAVIEMAGVPAVVPEGLGYLRPGGRYVLVGNITVGATVEIAPPDDSSQRESCRRCRDLPTVGPPRAIDWLRRRQDAYPFADLVSQSYALEAINDAIAASERDGIGDASGQSGHPHDLSVSWRWPVCRVRAISRVRVHVDTRREVIGFLFRVAPDEASLAQTWVDVVRDARSIIKELGKTPQAAMTSCVARSHDRGRVELDGVLQQDALAALDA